MQKKRNTTLILILLISLFIVGGLWLKYRSDIAVLKTNYKKEKAAEVMAVKMNLEEKFRYIYQTIRTMSLVPGVRKIDRYAENFDPDAKATIQQLYNNAFLNIQLSEIYLLPKTLDADKIDPHTKKPEEPIVTFDELIVGDQKKEEKEEVKKLEEVEIYEYRLMKTQLEDLARRFPKSSSFNGLEVPLVSGPEVITCDNSEFTQADFDAKNDGPRSGIVFTVPMYDANGDFNGGVSAVVRTNVFRKLFPDTSFGLINRQHEYKVANNPSRVWTQSEESFKKGTTPSELIFGAIEKLTTGDSAEWELWAAFDDNFFWEQKEVKDASFMFSSSVLVVLFFSVLIAFILIKDQRLKYQMSQLTETLISQSQSMKKISNTLTTAAKDMADVTTQQSSASQETASAMEQINAMVKKTAENAQELSTKGQASGQSSTQGHDLIIKVLDCANQLETFSKVASEKMNDINKGLQEISTFTSEIEGKTKVINEIVFQTKLLSFNASVEAARAGEHGKGFSVVAEEVGGLAQMSGDSAAQIMASLESGTEKIQGLVGQSSATISEFLSKNAQLIQQLDETAHMSKDAFENIQSQIEQINQMSEEITIATQEQTHGIDEVNKAISTISQSALGNTQSIEHILAGMNELNEESQKLDKLVDEISVLMKIKKDNPTEA